MFRQMYKEADVEKMRIPVKGDFIILGKMLGIDSGAARQRYKREKKEALEAMEKIFDSREQLIAGAVNERENLTESN